MTEPRRLRDDPDMPDVLREDLRRAADNPMPFDLEVGLDRLKTEAPGTTAGRAWPWVLAIGALVGGVGLWVAQDDPVVVDVDAPVVETPAEEARADPVDVQPDEEPIERVTTEEPPAEVEDPPEVTAPRPRPATAPEPTLQDEIAHMARLRAAAARNPRQALRLAAEGRRLFRNGMFGEEREAIAILALAQLDRDDEARRRGRRWLRRHPDSALAPRVRAATE